MYHDTQRGVFPVKKRLPAYIIAADRALMITLQDLSDYAPLGLPPSQGNQDRSRPHSALYSDGRGLPKSIAGCAGLSI